MKKIAKLFVTGMAIVAAALCLQSCEKMSERDKKLMLARENTFYWGRRIMSFSLNKKLYYDNDTWIWSDESQSGTAYDKWRSVILRNSASDTLKVYCFVHQEFKKSSMIEDLSLYIPEENGVPQPDRVKAEIRFSSNGRNVVFKDIPVSSFSIEGDEIDESNEKCRHLCGSFAFHYKPDRSSHIPELDVKDGMFFATSR
ncbi:MAG: hypothetical protein MJZ09_02090 [Bacteroidales bacterium]|nr:hypothetical protein [Bacteroidales bacterium]